MVLDASMIASIQDPNILDSIISGFAGGCIEPFVSHAICWVSDRYRGHPKDTIRTAQNNAISFLGQVNICIQGQQQIEGIEDKTKNALSDPDFTILFQEAVLGAARINSEQKHKILARLVTDRLSVEPDSLLNLSAHMACNAVPQLSNTHLRLLGLLYIIHNGPAPSYIMSLPYNERIKIGTEWFLGEIAHLIPTAEVTDFDFAHLAAVSCITYVPPNGLNSLWQLSFLVKKKLCTKGELCGLPKPERIPQIEQNQNGKDLLNLWVKNIGQSNMQKASLTPAGSLIGLYVTDAISHEH